MIDAIEAAIQVATSGLEAQSARLRVVAENLANANSTAATPGGDPYSRKTITFEDEMDRATGVDLVQIKDIGIDTAPFKVEYDPGNPAADASGFVKLPNVNIIDRDGGHARSEPVLHGQSRSRQTRPRSFTR